jgi:Ca2+-dependent lipid-binding protein
MLLFLNCADVGKVCKGLAKSAQVTRKESIKNHADTFMSLWNNVIYVPIKWEITILKNIVAKDSDAIS